MSEKRIREWAESGGGTIVLCNPDDACADCQELYAALATDPDVAVLAKELMEQHTLMDEEEGLWVNLEHGLLEGILEERFGIRLTPDGWEWVDDNA